MAGLKSYHQRNAVEQPVTVEPAKGSHQALCAWIQQWLDDPADLPKLKAHRERFAGLRRAERPSWRPPADYEAPEPESYLATLPPPPFFKPRSWRYIA